jgi:hypothetical protein
MTVPKESTQAVARDAHARRGTPNATSAIAAAVKASRFIAPLCAAERGNGTFLFAGSRRPSASLGARALPLEPDSFLLPQMHAARPGMP